MSRWIKAFRIDPIPVILSSKDPAIKYFVERDLLGMDTGDISSLWDLKEPQSIIKRQLDDGSWKYPGGGKEHLRSKEDYFQLEAYRQLGILIEKYGFNKAHPSIIKAAEFMFSRQDDEGDMRGIYGSQYSPNYTAAIMELLIKAGYEGDKRILKGFRWLLSIRQEDGGWAVPLRTAGVNFRDTLKMDSPIQPDRAKPFSHLVTGIVLRAFAAHPACRKSPDAIKASELLKSKFFMQDSYIDRKEPEYWGRVSYPFWMNDIVSSLDSLSLMGYKKADPQVMMALKWLAARQADDGLFDLKLLRAKDKSMKYWIALAICRSYKRFYG
jgi:hypothetical protein